MRFNIRDLAVGTFVILFAATLIFLFNRRSTSTEKLGNQNVTSPTPTTSIEDKVKGVFNVNIPAGVDKAELSDISGEGKQYFGLATRSYTNNVFDLTILCDLPENANYSAKLTKDDGMELNLGQLSIAKGGFMINFTKSSDLTDYKKVSVLRDNKILLTGRFM